MVTEDRVCPESIAAISCQPKEIAMEMFAWLLSAVPAATDPAPSIRNVLPDVPATDDTETTAPEMATDAKGGVPLDDVFAAIEYRDSAGRASRRRITMRRLVPRNGAVILQAICHERQAFRTFRCDRIGCFIDADGEILEPAVFWREIGIDLAAIATGTVRATKPAPGQDLRHALSAALAMLVALARCDRDIHPGEVDAILSYAADAADDLSLPNGAADLTTLEVLVWRMRPRRDSLAVHLQAVAAMPLQQRKRFVRAVKEVILADGRIAPEEIAMADEMEAWAAAQTSL